MYPILLTLGENIDKVFSSFDLWVFHFFGSMQCTFLTYVAKFFTTFGDEGFIIPLVVVGAVLCLFKRTRKFALSLIFAVVIGTLVTNIVVKPMALRVRALQYASRQRRLLEMVYRSRRTQRERLFIPVGSHNRRI